MPLAADRVNQIHGILMRHLARLKDSKFSKLSLPKQTPYRTVSSGYLAAVFSHGCLAKTPKSEHRHIRCVHATTNALMNASRNWTLGKILKISIGYLRLLGEIHIASNVGVSNPEISRVYAGSNNYLINVSQLDGYWLRLWDRLQIPELLVV